MEFMRCYYYRLLHSGKPFDRENFCSALRPIKFFLYVYLNDFGQGIYVIAIYCCSREVIPYNSKCSVLGIACQEANLVHVAITVCKYYHM